MAGLSAAIEADEVGASVIVLEKMKVTGGNTRISDGGVAAPNNYLQEKQGIEDSSDLFYTDMLGAGLGFNHPPLVKIVAEKATGAIDWTRNTLGVKYLDRLDRFGGHSVARCLTTKNHSGADFIRAHASRHIVYTLPVSLSIPAPVTVSSTNGVIAGSAVMRFLKPGIPVLE